MKWVTRERPKIDRIACPWLIKRFIDKQPEFLYVPADDVLTTAEETGAIPYDIPGREVQPCRREVLASTPSSPSTSSTRRASTSWPTSCAAPTPRGST